MTHDEYSAICVGDVLRFRGRLRPVVSVSRSSVVFPILRCSWTNSPITAYSRWEIIQCGRITGIKITKWRGHAAAALIEASRVRTTRPYRRIYNCEGRRW